MVLPLLKLTFIAVKQVSKPVANRIKAAALSSPGVRGAMVAVGRRLHFNTVQINRLADGESLMKRERVTVLNEKEALTRGSEFLGEMVVYTVSASILGVELWMSDQKAKKAAAQSAAKEEEALRLKEANEELQWQEFRQLNLKLIDLQERLSAMEVEAQRRRRWWS